MKRSLLLFSALLLVFAVSAQKVQKKDKAVFKEYKPGYYQNSILKGIEDYEKKEEAPVVSKRFKVDFTGMDIPASVDQFTKFWCQPPVSQEILELAGAFQPLPILNPKFTAFIKRK